MKTAIVYYSQHHGNTKKTCGFQSPVIYFDAIRKIVKNRHCRELGIYQCLGYDTFGPLKVIGGIAKRSEIWKGESYENRNTTRWNLVSWF